MSKKGNDTPSSVRIRENQRRSRNQRKELIHDLQRRVQEYEVKGVAATQDMQRAARKVAEENLRLRSMLASRGVSQSEIVTYLQSFDAGSVQNDFQRHSQAINHSLSTSQQTGLVVTGPTSAVSVEQASAGPTARSTSQFATQPLAQPPFQTQVQLQQSNSPSHVGLQPSSQCAAEGTQRAICDVRPETACARAPDCRPAEVPVEESPCQRMGNNVAHDDSIPTFSMLVNDADCPNTASCFCAPTSTPNEPSLDAGLLISCETAATIIAEMRGDTDKSRIRARLGCQGDHECNVKNTLVLELMDER